MYRFDTIPPTESHMHCPTNYRGCLESPILLSGIAFYTSLGASLINRLCCQITTNRLLRLTTYNGTDISEKGPYLLAKSGVAICSKAVKDC